MECLTCTFKKSLMNNVTTTFEIKSTILYPTKI